MTHRPILSIATAVLAVALAAPASAATPTPMQRSDSAPSASRTNDAEARDRRICVRLQIVGTRIPKRVCRTQWQWEQEGGVPTEED